MLHSPGSGLVCRRLGLRLLPRKAAVFASCFSTGPVAFNTNNNNVQQHSPKQRLGLLDARIDALVAHYEDFNGINSTAKDVHGKNLVNFNDSLHTSFGPDRLRVVPKDHAFFMANPPHEMIMRRLAGLVNKYINLPTVDQSAGSWLSQQDYSVMAGGTRLRPSDYKDFVRLASRLDKIDPQLKPDEVTSLLEAFKRVDVMARDGEKQHKQLDENGRAVTVGRRKSSSAKVSVVQSQPTIRGQFLVNGKPLDVYFPRLHDRASVIYPLKVVEAFGNYNVFATVQGGGTTGQADAIAHGLAKSLIIHNPLLAPRLRKAGCTVRDVRVKERKKPGKPKARKSNTWVKR